MFSIALSLLGAWILSWFGFDNLFIHGVNELFGLDLSTAGYYFIFALFGMLKNVLYILKPKAEIKFSNKNKNGNE